MRKPAKGPVKQRRVYLDLVPELLKPIELAQLLRVDPTTVRRWLHLNMIPDAYFISLPSSGKHLRYLIRKSYLTYLEEQGR